VFLVAGTFAHFSGVADFAAEWILEGTRCPSGDFDPASTVVLLQQWTWVKSAPRSFGAEQVSIVAAQAQGGGISAATSSSWTKRNLCWPMGHNLPIGILITAAAWALFVLGFHVHNNTKEQAARSVYLLVNFVLVLNYTFVILDSYDLCATLGMSESDSGRMVGNYMLGFCLGAFMMWCIASRIPGLWRSSPRRVLTVGLTCQLIGTSVYAWVAFKATQQVLEADYANIHFGVYEAMLGLKSGSPNLAFLLMASRFIAGMGSGLCQQFYVASCLHLTPVAERPEHTTRWVFSGMIAIGGGPMLAAGLDSFNKCEEFVPEFTLVGLGQVAVVACAFAAVFLYHPNLENVPDHMEKELVDDFAEASTGGLDVSCRRIVLVCGCLLMGSLRAFGVSAVEVVTASLLEDTYNWGQHKIGITIGVIFLTCVPVRVLHKMFGDKMSVVLWIRLMSVTAIAGGFLLFSPACSVLNKVCGLDCAGALVVAGTVLFPAFYMGEALAVGIMHQHVLPSGSWFDGNHSQLWYNLAQGLGRFLGPWISRWAIAASGQDFFALQQMMVTCVFLVIFECAVRPFMRSTSPSSADKASAGALPASCSAKRGTG